MDLLRGTLQPSRLALLFLAPFRAMSGQELPLEISDPDQWSPGDVVILGIPAAP